MIELLPFVFNAISTDPQLFYVKRFIAHLYLHFLRSSLWKVFVVGSLHNNNFRIWIILTQIYFTHRWDTNRYTTPSKWTMVMKEYSIFSKVLRSFIRCSLMSSKEHPHFWRKAVLPLCKEYSYAITVSNRSVYHHVLECVNGCVATSFAVVRPWGNFAVGKVDENIKVCLSLQNTKVYSQQQFVSNRWKKEREYEKLNRPCYLDKENYMSCGEKESMN